MAGHETRVGGPESRCGVFDDLRVHVHCFDSPLDGTELAREGGVEQESSSSPRLNFGERSSPGFNSGENSSLLWPYEVFDIRRAAGVEVSLQSENLHNLRNEVSREELRYVKAGRAAEDDLQATEKAFADAQAHLELKRAESKIDAHGSSKRKSSTTQAPSNTSTSASDMTVAEETMPDTFLIILPDTNDS
ncbi:hypothetical protein B0H13DRAFT_1887781 [Mycena leptocephala]|nr:hypothetical protein B0H13DRAFT_1887781 [Mycena leptocephala]